MLLCRLPLLPQVVCALRARALSLALALALALFLALALALTLTLALALALLYTQVHFRMPLLCFDIYMHAYTHTHTHTHTHTQVLFRLALLRFVFRDLSDATNEERRLVETLQTSSREIRFQLYAFQVVGLFCPVGRALLVCSQQSKALLLVFYYTLRRPYIHTYIHTYMYVYI